jgi:alkanesulfonate monooxygenase SsuD/methylene tetrahydromethanopterin reductase-like flavin-dependent oxidoreductase (luciferase family)
MQFAAYVASRIPRDRYLGFGVLSVPFYHPLRLVESMNLLDQLTEGRALFGVGSGWQGTEPEGLGIDRDYHASGRAAEDTLAVMERLWTFQTGDPEYSFSVGSNAGRIKRRVMPAPYTQPHPIIIRAASRESALIRAAEKGWPVFLGALGADVRTQARLYQRALVEARHSQEVVDRCLRWCSCDWLSVVVAETDAEARVREKRAHAEQIAIRSRYVQRHGKIDGPVIRPTVGQSTAEAYAAGGDMSETVAGSPDTIAAKVQELADLGINHLHLRFIGEWAGETRHICEASAALFAKEVMPRFSRATAHQHAAVV